MRLFWGLVLVTAASCATPSARNDFNANGMQRATYELQCPPERVEVTVLSEQCGTTYCAGSVVGARGCGRQTTYRNQDGMEWIRDSEVQTLESPQPAPAPQPSAEPEPEPLAPVSQPQPY